MGAGGGVRRRGECKRTSAQEDRHSFHFLVWSPEWVRSRSALSAQAWRQPRSEPDRAAETRGEDFRSSSVERLENSTGHTQMHFDASPYTPQRGVLSSSHIILIMSNDSLSFLSGLTVRVINGCRYTDQFDRGVFLLRRGNSTNHR